MDLDIYIITDQERGVLCPQTGQNVDFTYLRESANIGMRSHI